MVVVLKFAIAEIKFYGHRENDLVRLPDPTNVLKYPHIAMTGPARRGYAHTGSSEHSSSTFAGYLGIQNAYIFDNDPATFWHSETNDGTNNQRYNGTDDLYTGTNTLGGVSGEWLKLQLPHKIILSKVHLRARSGYETQAPEDFSIIGSNNDSTWYLIQSFTGESPQDDGTSYYNITSNPTEYKYLAIVIQRLVGTSAASIATLEFYGTGVDSIPIQIGGGNIDKVANFRVYDKFVGEDQALEIWDAQKDHFGRAKSSMTLYKGRLGIGTTEPEGRLAVLDEPHNLEEFPPRAMTGYKTYFEGHGEFCVSASSEYNAVRVAWKAFDKFLDVSSSDNTWTNNSNTNYDGTDNTYNPSVDGINLGTGAVYGEWIKLELPYKINLKHMKLYSKAPNDPTRIPEDFKVYGSNDNSNWTELISVTGRLTVFETIHNVHTDSMYKYFGLVVTKISGQSNYFRILELRYFGTREQGQSVLHDGQLTLTKNLNVPRIGPALDADDTPRRDRLVVEYNTSTNPVEDGFVQDTSGRGLDGMFYGGASYDATQKALVFDGDGDYIQMRDWNYGTGFIHSFSGWVKIKSPEESWTVLYGVGNASGAGRTNFTIWALTTNSYFRTEADGSGSHIDHTFEFTGNLDKWMHVAVVKSGAAINTTRMYINGEILPQTGGSNASSDLALPDSPQTFTLGTYSPSPGSEINADYSNVKFYDTALTAEEVKTLYDMGRCDEGHHVVNFSKTRVGIGLGDGEAPMGDLDVRGPVVLGPGTLPEDYWFQPALTIFETFRASTSGRPGGGIQFCQHDSPGQGWMMGVDTDTATATNGCELVWEFHNNGSRTGRGAQLSAVPNIASINFTGQHRTFIKDVPFSQVGDLEGLIVSSDQNKYIKMSGGIEAGSNAITTNESLPIVSLSNVVTDKKCFGVISASEDPKQRTDAYGIFKSFYPKEKGDTRVYINSVGEGAIWVSNISGSSNQVIT